MDYELWAERLVWGILVLFISPFIIYNTPQLLGLDAHVVGSGSMRPTMPPGTVLYEAPVDPNTLKEGDIIVFEPNDTRIASDKVTHRIVDIREGNYSRQFKTMGDANPAPDPGLTPAYKVDGKKVFTIPYLGYVIQVMKSPVAILFFVVVPASVLMRSHLIRLLDAVDEQESPSDGGNSVNRPVMPGESNDGPIMTEEVDDEPIRVFDPKDKR